MKKCMIVKWPRIYERENKGGSVSFVVDLGEDDQGKRQRHFFKIKAEAEGFAEVARQSRESDGLARFTLPREVAIDAQRGAELLKPFGVSLVEAARYYVKHCVRFQAAPTINQAIPKLLMEMKSNGRRERTIRDVKNRLENFGRSFGDKRFSEITLDGVKQWAVHPTWSGRTRNHYLTKLSQLFNFAVRHDYVEKNIVDLIPRPSIEQPKTEILTVSEAESLLKHANKFGLLPYVAIGLFGGLRSAELSRLETSAINFEDGIVTVCGKIAKKRARRHVTMNETLRSWLEVCSPLNEGPIVRGKTFEKDFRALRKAAGIKAWPHNGLRHSFASYHFAKFGDSTKTAELLGHSGSLIVRNHYLALVTKSEAEKFWALRPEAVTTNGENSVAA